MWTHHSENRKRRIIIVMAVIVVLLIMLLLLFKSCGNTPPLSNDDTETKQEEKTLDFIPASEKGKINIPGYEGIYLMPGQLNQKVSFYNPDTNNCYFVISLYLSDDTLIYESDYIAPGEKITDITLLKSLQQGLYNNCHLRYRCFTLTDKTEINGSTQTIKINTN